MAADDTTIQFTLRTDDGSLVPALTLARTLQRLIDLLSALSKQVVPDRALAWGVAELRSGSAVCALGPIGNDFPSLDAARRVGRALDTAIVGYAAGGADGVPYSDAIREATAGLAIDLGATIPALELIIGGRERTVARARPEEDAPRDVSLGTVTGRVLSMTAIGKDQFTVIEDTHGRAVQVSLTGTWREFETSHLWKQRVHVEGLISRDSVSGKTTVRDIMNIHVLPPIEIDIPRLRGILDIPASGEELLGALRRVRHGE